MKEGILIFSLDKIHHSYSEVSITVRAERQRAACEAKTINASMCVTENNIHTVYRGAARR